MKITEVIFESIKKNVMEDFDKEANAYKAHLIKTLPQIIGLFANTGKGWMPSEEQMLAAVETGYQIMKRTGSVKQAGAAVGNEINALYKASQKGVAESTLQEIYKMPPTRNSSQGLAVWAYNDALEEKSPIFYKNNNVIIYKASEELLRYIILQDEKPVLYIGFRKFLDGYQSGVVGTEMTGRGKGLAQKAYLNASDILDVPIYSDTTQTDASRLGIWNKLIQQYPNRVVGYDQKSGRDLPLQITDQGPVINQNQPIYVKSSKKHKYIALNDRSRTRLLKLLPNTQQSVAESTKGVTPTGYTWSFEQGSEVPYKSDVEVNTFIRVRDSKGKTVLGVWADVYRDDVEIQYSEVFDKKLRGKGIYTDFLKGLAEHYNIISDKDHNNAAINIYKKLGADYNSRSEKHTLRRSNQSVAEDTVDEMALKSYTPLGKFQKPGPFKDPDYKLVTHPAHIKKVEKFFQNTPYNFRIFVSNLPGLTKYRESGQKTPDQIREIFGKNADQIIKDSEDAITIIFLGNFGDARVMLTPWVMAHRLGHSINSTNRGLIGVSSPWKTAEDYFFTTINTILANYYGKTVKGPGSYYSNVKWDLKLDYNALFNAIGTQRSSRTGQIKRPYEFMYELLAQYLKDGTVTLNPVPLNVKYGREAWGNPTMYMNLKPEFRSDDGRKSLSEKITTQINSLFAIVLQDCVGKIFVM